MIEVTWLWNTNLSAVNGFRYLWLKTVNGFNPVYHCARCLTGSYSKAFSPKMQVNNPIIQEYKEGQVLYFCGVSSPYKWNDNLHLAGIVTQGEKSIVKAYNGDSLLVHNLKQIHIDPSISSLKFQEKGKEFLTCRNFQLGAQLFTE